MAEHDKEMIKPETSRKSNENFERLTYNNIKADNSDLYTCDPLCGPCHPCHPSEPCDPGLCDPDSLTKGIYDKPWYCTYNPYAGEWEENIRIRPYRKYRVMSQ